MREPSLPTVKRLFACSGNKCAYPKCECPIVETTGTVTGIICHISARSKGGPRFDGAQSDEQRHSHENLILLCARHSKLIDSEPKTYTVELLREMKTMHERNRQFELSAKEAQLATKLLDDYRAIFINTSGNVEVHGAENVVIRPTTKRVKIQAPAGSLASDLSKRNYIKHLIDRYHEFADQQPGRVFSYPAIYAEIKKHYGAKWDMTTVEQFGSLVAFLQARIDRTMRGSINRGKGYPNYSTFEEYRVKYGSR